MRRAGALLRRDRPSVNGNANVGTPHAPIWNMCIELYNFNTDHRSVITRRVFVDTIVFAGFARERRDGPHASAMDVWTV
jgi:hypothetical protein